MKLTLAGLQEVLRRVLESWMVSNEPNEVNTEGEIIVIGLLFRRRYFKLGYTMKLVFVISLSWLNCKSMDTISMGNMSEGTLVILLKPNEILLKTCQVSKI